MKCNDVLSGALAGVFALAIFLGAQGLPKIPGQNVGPKVFPELIAAGMMLCAVMLIVRGLKTLGSEKWVSLPDWMGQGRAVFGFLLVPLCLVFYVVASEDLGFIPTAILLLLAMFLTYGARWRTALVVALLGSVCIHALFYKMLKVPLPWGVLTPFAW